ncbi:MAG: hypothetical protein ACO3CH_00200 [Ilumatobacteraceae bacterium]
MVVGGMLVPNKGAEAPAPETSSTVAVAVAVTSPTDVQSLTYLPETVEHPQPPKNRIQHYGITFTHGDISWLPDLAAEAGWPENTWEKLGQIILRESGGCPNRRGGDVVNKNCVITRVSEWNHRSDTGLLQINGVNYNMDRNKWAALCREMQVCEQEPLFDPLVNLKAGKILYDLSGWGPWDPCTWDKTRCPKKKKP